MRAACWRVVFLGIAVGEELEDWGGISRGVPPLMGGLVAAPVAAPPEACLTRLEPDLAVSAQTAAWIRSTAAAPEDETAAVSLIGYAAVAIGGVDNGAFETLIAAADVVGCCCLMEALHGCLDHCHLRTEEAAVTGRRRQTHHPHQQMERVVGGP